MRWLEDPRDETELFLQSALNRAAKQVGDEMARRRVWASIEALPLVPSPQRPRRHWLVPALTGAFVACGVAAFLLVPVFRPSARVSKPTTPESKTPTAQSAPVSSTPRVALGQGAEVELEPSAVLGWDSARRPSVDRGRARFRVAHQPPGQHFAVAAGPYLISVIGTKFSVRVTDDRVGVDVEEGIVEVWRGMRAVRLVAGDSWAGPLNDAAPVATPKPSATSATSSRPAAITSELREAQEALAAGQPEQAVAILKKLSRGTGASAENAAYELGRILRDNLQRPREAVAVWSRYRSRFPHGLLRAEADLSLIETLASMGDRDAALAEAEEFLTRHPSSERRADVERIVGRLRGSAGR